MPYRRYQPKPKEGEEISVSILAIETREEMLWISSKPVSVEEFPPCIKSILKSILQEGSEKGKGRHRSAAILAAFLGQAGWSETEAKQLWSQVAGVEERIFTEWFQRMHCPKCETLKRTSEGYPDLGIADLDLCQTDERCKEFQGPVEYASVVKTDEDRLRGHLLHIRTLYHARVLDWSSGREGEIELSEAEKVELEDLQKEQAEQKDKTLVYTRARVRGRLRPRFFLKQAEGPRRQMLSEFL